MRQTINILWLEDEITSDAHSNRKYLVEDILQEKDMKLILVSMKHLVKLIKNCYQLRDMIFLYQILILKGKKLV